MVKKKTTKAKKKGKTSDVLTYDSYNKLRDRKEARDRALENTYESLTPEAKERIEKEKIRAAKIKNSAPAPREKSMSELLEEYDEGLMKATMEHTQLNIITGIFCLLTGFIAGYGLSFIIEIFFK